MILYPPFWEGICVEFNISYMVKNVVIKGQEMPLKFGINVLIDFCDASQLSFDELGKLGQEDPADKMKVVRDLKHIRKLIFMGLKNGARVAGVSFSLTEDLVGDMFENLGDLTAVMTVFAESMSVPEDTAPLAPVTSDVAGKQDTLPVLS